MFPGEGKNVGYTANGVEIMAFSVTKASQTILKGRPTSGNSVSSK